MQKSKERAATNRQRPQMSDGTDTYSISLLYRHGLAERVAPGLQAGLTGCLLPALFFFAGCGKSAGVQQGFKLITLDPGHFHAALVYKEALPGVLWKSYVYAPQGPELLAHIDRIARYNSRENNPTRWVLEVYAAPDYFERMLAEKPGRIVVISGKNKGKIQKILACVRAGLHVLADKPWIIDAREFPDLRAALREAEKAGVIVYDMMTQRFAARYILAREFVSDPDIFGKPVSGTSSNPGVYLESLHSLAKEVSGVPSLRPVWFFDVEQQGESLADVGTHLVDLVFWVLFPNQPVDWRRDITIASAHRWPTYLSEEEFRRVTGAPIPKYLRRFLHDKRFEYHCNNAVDFTVKGIHAAVKTSWVFKSQQGDIEYALFRGTKASVLIEQGKGENRSPELYVVPKAEGEKASIKKALRRRIASINPELYGRRLEGIKVVDQGERLKISVPKAARLPHEAHFAALVKSRFLSFVMGKRRIPTWEKANMLAKYFVTTHGVQLARWALKENK